MLSVYYLFVSREDQIIINKCLDNHNTMDTTVNKTKIWNNRIIGRKTIIFLLQNGNEEGNELFLQLKLMNYL